MIMQLSPQVQSHNTRLQKYHGLAQLMWKNLQSGKIQRANFANQMGNAGLENSKPLLTIVASQVWLGNWEFVDAQGYPKNWNPIQPLKYPVWYAGGKQWPGQDRQTDLENKHRHPHPPQQTT